MGVSLWLHTTEKILYKTPGFSIFLEIRKTREESKKISEKNEKNILILADFMVE
jgi:hypothetical protein